MLRIAFARSAFRYAARPGTAREIADFDGLTTTVHACRL